ncbi:MAG: ribose 5-phosphate isomerase B [Mycoplasmataceae bacterium]|nr:ribose 5-phosphate isomerase B [Mycoplasmataceae bacterium]
MITNKIALASDHAGFDLKEEIKEYLSNLGVEIVDLGTNDNTSVNYASYGKKMGQYIKDNKDSFGIIVCGTGIGISIAANRYKEVRAALCHSTEYASLARKHNDANVLALGSRFGDSKESINIVKEFFTTDFEGGRHKDRVDTLGEKV